MPTTRTEFSPCHIVQIGSDDTVFTVGLDSEFVQRQVKYGEISAGFQPDSLIDIIIFTREKDAETIQVNNVRFNPLIVDLRGWSKFKAWYHLYSMLNSLERERHIDVLTTQTAHDEAWVALLFAKRRKCASVGQIHYDIFNAYAVAPFKRSYTGRIRYALMLRFLKHFTAIRVVSKGIAREIESRNLHHNVRVLPVYMGMIADQRRPKASYSENKKVLFVGRLVEQKNLEFWIGVAELVVRAVPEARFELVGEGKLRPDLEALVAQKGMSGIVTFTGVVSYDRLPEIYQSASVFLITSLYEGFGRVVAEALANGIPVVAPRITGIEDIVVDGHSGFLVDPADLAGTADRVIFLLRNPAMAAEMGEWGEGYVREHFDPETLSRNWIQLLFEAARSI
jgi:glycosyltransferase involved in cell wall biosynthesis